MLAQMHGSLFLVVQYLSMFKVYNDEWKRDFFWMKNQRTTRKEKAGQTQTPAENGANFKPAKTARCSPA
jgi:hypothetical protein